MKLILPREWEQRIRAHGERAYPHECCGILAGKGEGDTRRVFEVHPLANLREQEGAEKIIQTQKGESAANRYLIDPREQMRVERHLEQRGLALIGFYHSHPDVAPRPSQYDFDHAWPFYFYLIVSVRGGKSAGLQAWLLRDDRSAFQKVRVERK